MQNASHKPKSAPRQKVSRQGFSPFYVGASYTGWKMALPLSTFGKFGSLDFPWILFNILATGRDVAKNGLVHL